MRVQLNLRTNILHTSAVVTGFHMLAEAGKLTLEINDIRRAAAEFAAPSSVNTVARDAFSAQYGASAPEDALIDAVVDGSFFGGIYRDGFSERYCPELLVGKAVTLKRSYLHRMRCSDICINTMGLHGSIGWKTAEYVAAARAIESEEFVYSVPGGFDDGVNYLSFRSPEECAERVEMLMEDEKARLEMSRANRDYYENSLRPDAQIRQALRQL